MPNHDMSSQGPAGLSKPAFGATPQVQEHGGFANTMPAGTNNIGEQYAAAPSPAFPAQDKSSQGMAGTTNTMVNSIEATRNFGAGN